MRKKNLTPSESLGVEAGIYMPARILGDAPPPPRRLRRAAVVLIAGAVGAGVVVVNTVPDAAHTWKVVSHQTGKVLGRVLGKAELQTAEILTDLTTEVISPAEAAGSAPLH